MKDQVLRSRPARVKDTNFFFSYLYVKFILYYFFQQNLQNRSSKSEQAFLFGFFPLQGAPKLSGGAPDERAPPSESAISAPACSLSCHFLFRARSVNAKRFV